MIIETSSGRRVSCVTDDEIRRDIYKRMESLSSDEYSSLMKIVDEFNQTAQDGEVGFDNIDELKKSSSVYNELTRVHYEDELVSVREFCLNKKYLGGFGQYLYERWLLDLEELFSKPYNEAVITGSIGSGKSSFAETGLGYIFYELCMLRNPQETFGLPPDSPIVLVCFNRDQQLARDVTFGGLKRKLEQGKFFQNLGVKFGTSYVSYEKKHIIIIPISSRSANALGKDVFGGIIDETEFMEGSILKGSGLSAPGGKSFAELLRDSIIRRMKSRYDRAGILPGKLFMASSARHKQSFINRRISEGVTDPYLFCRDYAIYDVAPQGRFSKEKFWVLVGNERIDHKILTRKEYFEMGNDKRNELESHGCKFIRVPMNFKPDFKSNLEDSIRDIAGIVTATMSVFFQMRSKIYEAVDPTLVNPIRSGSWVTDEDPGIDWTKLVRMYRRRISPGRFVDELMPIRHPEAQRHVHMDLSLGVHDPAGISIVHIAGYIDIERRSSDGVLVIETMPLIEVDLVLRIMPPSGKEIDFGAIRGLIYDFTSHGYSISFASCDSFQSRDMLQRLAEKGIDGKIISVDKTMDPYTCLKTCIYEGRLSMYKHDIVLEELEQLQRNDVINKVVHTESGSKDCADALAGCVFSITTENHFNAPILKGESYSEPGEGTELERSEWVRQTMVKSGDKAPVPLSALDSSDGPLVFSG